jgi:hypothetical protein
VPRGEGGGPEESHTGHAGQVRGPRRLGWALVRNMYRSVVSDLDQIGFVTGIILLDPDHQNRLLDPQIVSESVVSLYFI